MTITTVRIHQETKELLDGIRSHPRETYEDIVKKLVEFYTRKIPEDKADSR